MTDSPAPIDILIFEIGSHIYGADATQVLRIDRADPQAHASPCLGPLKSGRRALVFDRGEGEEQLSIDAVSGLRSVPVHSLRRLPAAARAAPCAVGLWLDGEQPILLLDLWKTSDFQGRQ